MHKLEVADKDILLSECKKLTSIKFRNSRFLLRMYCVLLVAQNCSCYQIAKWFGENPRTIERWVHKYHKFGIEGLRIEQKTGRPGKVGTRHIEQLIRDIADNPSIFGYEKQFWNGKLLKRHLEYHYRIELSERQCQRLLHTLKIRVKHHAHSLIKHKT